jgi:putative ABC transport system permease protein
MHWRVSEAIMSSLRQIYLVTLMNLKSLPQRLGSSCVVVIGIAGVVGVLVSVLAISTSLAETMLNTARGDRVLVLADGARFEGGSFLPNAVVHTILAAHGIKRSADGKLAASAEMATAVNLPRNDDDSSAGVSVRGLAPAGLQMRPNIKLIQGRLYRSGIRELIVGLRAQQEFSGLEMGDVVGLQNSEWTVVGVFESGDLNESGLLTDATTLLSAYQRTSVNSVVVELEPDTSVEDFKTLLTDNSDLSVEVLTEADYYLRASENITQLLDIVSTVIGAVMAAGAVFGALNTMYSAISVRGVEIATLRAIGFGSSSVIVSVLVEALILALMGALLGAALAWLFFNGNLISMGGGSSVVVKLEVTVALLGTGILWACAVGLVGGLFPAVRAARLPIAAALREL